MSPQLGQTLFRVAFFMTLMSAVLLFFVKPGSAEFVITVTTLVLGFIFMAVIVIIARRSK